MLEFIIVLIKVLFVFFGVTMPLASLSTWIERKGSALLQDRIGANRAGAYFDFDLDVVRSFPLLSYAPQASTPFRLILNFFAYLTYALLFFPVKVIKFLGMLGVINTLLNDAVKALFKEDFVPEGVSNFLHCLAPFMAVFPVFVAFALIPLAPDFTMFGVPVRVQVASLDVGVLFILAMGSIAVYGVAMAGWTGNNKYSLLGGLRAAAQMISYELAMGITIVTSIIVYSTTDLYEMVVAQSSWWGVFTQPLGFIILFIVGMAETKRAPFDLPESESELVAGYFTEYSGMKFLIFWLGEFAEIGLFALILALFFFGGWHPLPGVSLDSLLAVLPLSWAGDTIASVLGAIGVPGALGVSSTELSVSIAALIGAVIGHAILMGKVTFFCILQIVIRWTLPRFRYDQLMNLGWKILLPLSVANLLVTAVVKLWGLHL